MNSTRQKQVTLMGDEKGSAIIIAMFILVIVTLIGIAAMQTGTLEQQIAGYDAAFKNAFFNADAGISWALASLAPKDVDFGGGTGPGAGKGKIAWFDVIQRDDLCGTLAHLDCHDLNLLPWEHAEASESKFEVPASEAFEVYFMRKLGTNAEIPRIEVKSLAKADVHTSSARGRVSATVTAALDIGGTTYQGAEKRLDGDELTYQ